MLCVCAVVLQPAAPARAVQTGGAQRDTLRVTPLDTLVVSVERVPLPLAVTSGAVSALARTELLRAPVHTVAAALTLAPGVAFVDRDGLGGDPQLMMRAFYGGGEAEYALLLLDGRPLNHLETGRIDWDMIPLAAVASIEIVRGGLSGAWGDAAIGGIINIRTREPGAGRGALAALSAGGHGVTRASLSYSGQPLGRPLTLLAHHARAGGFRTNAARDVATVRATGSLIDRADRAIAWSTTHAWRDYDEPGPLTEADLASSRTQSAPFFRFDRVAERTHRLGLDGSITRASSRSSGFLALEYRHADRVRTLPLAPSFADTQERVLTSWRVSASGQLALDELPLPGDDDLVIGLDASMGWLTSSYYGVFRGSPEAYASVQPGRGELNQRGSGGRAALAGFFGYGVALSPAVRLTAGGRLDGLRDTFEDEISDGAVDESTVRIVFNPRAGANVRIIERARQRGHLYAAVSRSFKAPTPDQLFDVRKILLPFPPFRLGLSNPELEPQYGTNLEAGMVHDAELVPGRLAAGLTLSVWEMRLRDELDFSVETFRYENIGRSRHRGVELGLRVRGPADLLAFANYTRQTATARSGENAGRALKAIPLHWLVAGVQAGGEEGFAGGLTVTHAARMYIDDANTRELPDWTRWDGRIAYTRGGPRLVATVTNLLNATYSTTGFPDPAGTDLVYWYPAAGRIFEFGLEIGW